VNKLNGYFGLKMSFMLSWFVRVGPLVS